MFKQRHVYMLENDGEGNDLPAAVDRGDEIDTPDTLTKSDAVDKQAEEDLKSLEAEKEAEEKEEQPRDSSGKFAKKEREVPDHVPKKRMDEAVSKEREAREAAERRAAELEARLKQEEKSVDVQKMEEAIEGLEKQHAKLLLDGEMEKAAAVMKQIRHNERQIAKMETEEKAGAAVSQAVEQVRMDAAIAKLEADYPQFNPESEEFNQKMVNLVLAEQRRLITEERMAPSKALLTAAKDVMEMVTPKPKDDEGKGLAAAQKTADRKSEQVAKNLDTAKRQPASMKDSGMDSDKAGKVVNAEVSNMTMDEWAALPESTRAKLRGDAF